MSVIQITEDNFEAEVLNSDNPVIVDFYGRWCGPCNLQLPILEEIAEEHPEVKVGRIDVDNERALVQKYKVHSVPALFYFKDGKLVRGNAGVMSRDLIEKMIAK